jgi:DNA-binding IclR family transcriptional regulator
MAGHCQPSGAFTSEGAEGLRCFAVSITADGQCVGAVRISGPSAELERGQYTAVVPLLEEAAADLAHDAQLVRGLWSLAGFGALGETS